VGLPRIITSIKQLTLCSHSFLEEVYSPMEQQFNYKKKNESEIILFIKCHTKGIKTFSFYDSRLKEFLDF
jgi:hypothetical protein